MTTPSLVAFPARWAGRRPLRGRGGASGRGVAPEQVMAMRRVLTSGSARRSQHHVLTSPELSSLYISSF